MEMEKVLLYSPEISPRLTYIASHIAEEMLGARVVYAGSPPPPGSSDLPVINYSASELPGAINIFPDGLLGETGIPVRSPGVEIVDGIPLIFPSPGRGNRRFDLFAASFYLLSRYEEYLPFRKDRHGRFPYSESLACRHSVSEEPMVEMWGMMLRAEIEKKYPRFRFRERKFTFIPTIDVDIPWAFRNRGLWRTAGGFARSLLKADIAGFRSRYRVLFRGEPDPYDTFDLIGDMHDKRDICPLFFFSAGSYGRYDKSIPPDDPEYRALIAAISSKYGLGIHPSYRSFEDEGLLEEEIGRISEITGEPVSRSRQHYLRLSLPGTCRLLIMNGISEDYSLGWAETPGFRAGTCTPFMFYDLEREEVTPLRIFPFQIMDGSLRDYMGLGAGEAVSYACRIIEKVRKVNGTLVTLWHNESFSGQGRWKNWTAVYNDIIGSAAP